MVVAAFVQSLQVLLLGEEVQGVGVEDCSVLGLRGVDRPGRMGRRQGRRSRVCEEGRVVENAVCCCCCLMIAAGSAT